MFFVGLILTIISAFYLREEESVLNDLENHVMNTEPLVDRQLPQDLFDANRSLDPRVDIIVKPSHEYTTELTPQSSTTPTVTTTSTDRPITERNDGFNYHTIPGLEDLAPDSALRRFVDNLSANRNEFNLQDIPPAIDDMMQYFRRVFSIPRIRLDFGDK